MTSLTSYADFRLETGIFFTNKSPQFTSIYILFQKLVVHINLDIYVFILNIRPSRQKHISSMFCVCVLITRFFSTKYETHTQNFIIQWRTHNIPVTSTLVHLGFMALSVLPIFLVFCVPIFVLFVPVLFLVTDTRVSALSGLDYL
jgi:hypothetical protein